MSLAAKMRRAPGRVVTGAFILNTGLEKFRKNDDETAKGIHNMAAGAYPVLDNVEPKVFLRTLGAGEIVLGSVLLLPIVPAGVAGLGLVAFATGMLGVYWRTPGMHLDNDPRPTQHGTPLAKDVWMLGIGSGLLLDSVLSGKAERAAELRGEVKGAAKAMHVSEAASAGAAGALTALHSVSESARSTGRAAAREAKAVAKERSAEARAATGKAARKAAAEAKASAKSVRESAESLRESAETSAKSMRKSAQKSTRSMRRSAAKSAKSARKRAAAQAHAAAESARSTAETIKAKVA